MNNYIPSNTEYYNMIGPNRDSFYREKKSCVSNTTCDDCIAKINSNCIIYNGSSFVIPSIKKGQNLNDVLKTIVNNLGDKNIQSDWAQSNSLAADFIKNKPDLSIYYLASNPAGYIDSSYVTWNNVSDKPSFAQVAFTGDYNDLINIPVIQIPDLQTVTDVGSTTTNPIYTTNNIIGGISPNIITFPPSWVNDPNYIYLSYLNQSSNSALLIGGLNGGKISTISYSNTVAHRELTLDTTSNNVDFLMRTEEPVHNIRFIRKAGMVFPLGTPNLQFLDNDNNITNTLFSDGRLSGEEAVNGNEFVTLSQISGLGSGTVTSVGLSSSDITIGGTNPITTSGTISLTLPNVNSNIGTFNNLTVNAKGQVISASNIAYLTTETDPTVPSHVKTITTTNISNWNTAFGWGNHTGLYVPLSRTVTAGTGLTGGGVLSANITLSANFGTSVGTIAQGNDSRINNGQTAFSWGNHASAGYATASNSMVFTNKSGNISQWTNNVGYITSETDPTAIKNQTTVQTANFNISGNGTIAGITITPNITSPSGSDLIISTDTSQQILLNIGSSNLIHITNDGVGIGNLIPNSARASKLEVSGNIWSEDAFILGASGTSAPRSEYGLSGVNDAFIRMMNTGNLDLITNETTTVARVNGTTENFEIMNQIKISGGTPGIGKVLMDSDGLGLGEWTTIGGGTGTVTSVALSLPSIFSVSGSPITTSGTLSASLVSQTTNLVFASPNGSTGTPTFRSLVAADIPTLTSSKISDFTTAVRGSISQGTGISYSSVTGIITNSAPDQTVVLSNGAGISVTGTYPNFTITNTAPNTNQNLNQVLTTGNISTLSATVGDLIVDEGSGLGRTRIRLVPGTGGGSNIIHEVSPTGNGTDWSTSGSLSIQSGDVIIDSYTLVNDEIESSVGMVTPALQITGGSPSIGDVWTATDTSGNGSWQPAGSSSTGPFFLNLSPINTGTGTLDIISTDVIIRVSPTTLPYTINLPDPIGNNERILILRNQSATNAAALSEVIQLLNGSSTTNLPIQTTYTIISDNVNWIQLF